MKIKALLKALLLAVVLMLFPVGSGIIVSINSIPTPQMYWLQGTFMLLALLVAFFIVFINKLSLSALGLRPIKKGSAKTLLYFIPLIAAKSMYFFFPLHEGVALWFALIFFTLAIGLAEEFYFRGLILRSLMPYFKTPVALVLSSLFFALVHASQALAGADFLRVMLTVVNAFIFGFVAAEITLLTQSLWPTFLWHAFYNFVNFISFVSGTPQLVLIIIESVIVIIYGLYLWTKLHHLENEAPVAPLSNND